MAKSTKNAALICVILSVIALIGIALGIWKSNSYVVIAAMLPAVVYEIYRTEGVSTKAASIGMLVVLVALIVMLAMKISFNIAPFLAKIGITSAVDAKLAGPVIIAVLAFILLRQTAGIYTRWLAVIIFVTAVGLFYVLDPSLFGFLLKLGAQEGAKRIK